MVDTTADWKKYLPVDADQATLIGRVWGQSPTAAGLAGPLLVTADEQNVYEISGATLLCSELLSSDDVHRAIGTARLSPPLCSLETLMANSIAARDKEPYLLSPVDLQAIKAAGVTFAVSLLERLVEEASGGDRSRARLIRSEIETALGDSISGLRPGTKSARRLEDYLRKQGLWSQYCEVAFGPYAEIFTKSQVLSSVGCGAQVGIHPDSEWNNPEPEVVLVVNDRQEVVGATLGNDVNLRDIEGRSALLLGRAKDNNASCSLGPFIRLLDAKFTLDDIRQITVKLSDQISPWTMGIASLVRNLQSRNLLQ